MKIGIAMSSSKTQYYINQAYADYVKEAGFQPVLIVPGNDVNLFADIIDGLVLPGGIDLDPIYYGEDNYNSYSVDPHKDEFERTLLHAVRERGKPIFGICRGFQLIIREYLLQDPELTEFLHFYTHIADHAQTTGQQLDRNIYSHFVDYRPPVLYGYKTDNKVEAMPVNSMHHQCLMVNFKESNVVAMRGFHMAAWTTRGIKFDKTNKQQKLCESFRIKGWGAPVLAVQWHPEELRDLELIQNFFGGQQVVTPALA
jgi:gamma-glutamyl-gamma-aminobutyrate hydrolase PuuD